MFVWLQQLYVCLWSGKCDLWGFSVLFFAESCYVFLCLFLKLCVANCLQTGSGKTYTMMGEIKETEGYLNDDSGITPRVFDYLFMRIKAV